MEVTAPAEGAVAVTSKLGGITSSTLLALTASALALPGVSGQVRADAAPTQTTVGYRFSSYEEDDLDRSKLVTGNPERYEIDIHQFRLVTPIGETFALSLDSSYESMSGASPWYVIRQGNGDAGVVMSGATISEQRRDFTLNGRRYLDNGSYAFTVGASNENDYNSVSVGFDGERHFNNDLTTVATGISFSSDDIDPTDASLFNRVTDESRHSSSVFLSISQVLNQTSVFQTALNITHLSGFLTDPYKLGDSRPDSRTQIAWSNAYRHFYINQDAALQINYRFYDDSFGVNSHTVDLAWHQNIGDNFQLVPRIRYYSQSQADFFTAANDFSLPASQHQSSDYRLSSYAAISGSLKLTAIIDNFKLSLSVERYVTDSSYSAFSVSEESPALVQYTRLSFGIEYQY